MGVTGRDTPSNRALAGELKCDVVLVTTWVARKACVGGSAAFRGDQFGCACVITPAPAGSPTTC